MAKLHHLGNYDKETLVKAIKSTFKNRNTNFVENHSLFTESFITDKYLNKMWKSIFK